MSNSLRLAIVKYSYSPDFAVSSQLPIASENKVAWTTIANSNLLVAIEPSKFGLLNSSTPELCLKVLRDSEVLELVQLQRLCEAAVSSPWNQKPIQAVVSSPRLAITYHVGDSTARRLQFRFANESDFDSAVSVLENLRCPITAATNRPRTAQRQGNAPNPTTDHGERPTTSGSTDVYGTRRLTTPVSERDAGVQPYPSVARRPRDSLGRDDLNLQALSQSQLRPATAPMTQEHLTSQSVSPLWEKSFDGQSCSSQLDRGLATDPPAASFSKTYFPPLPTPTFTKAALSANPSGQLNSRVARAPEDVSGNLTMLSRAFTSISPLGASSLQADRSSSPTVARTPQERDPLTRLREYAARPNSERQTIIDTMLCRYINSDDFLRLCEDVENSWKRIGIDMQRGESD